MKIQRLEEIIRYIFEEDMKLMRAKNHDYSSDADALENFKDWGIVGFSVRLGDKCKRLKNILQKGEAKIVAESTEDTLKDISIYSYLARAYIIEESRELDRMTEISYPSSIRRSKEGIGCPPPESKVKYRGK